MRIRTKLLVFLLPMAIVSVVVMTQGSRVAVRSVVAAELGKRGVASAADFAGDEAVVSGFRARSENRLLPSLYLMVERTGAIEGAALGPEGEVVAHTNVAEHGATAGDPATREALRAKEPRYRLADGVTPPVMDVWLPVYDTSHDGADEAFLLLAERDRIRLGTLHLRLPLEDALDTSARISRQVFVIITLVSGLALVLMLLVVGRILSPVPLLLSATRRLGSGGLGETVPVLSRDELGDLAASFNRMSQDLAQTTVSREFLNSILVGMQDALLVTGRDGDVRMVNQSALRMLGYTEQELLGCPVSKLFAGSEAPPGGAGDGPAVGGPGVSGGDSYLVDRDGRGTPVLVGVSALAGPDQDVQGYVLTAKDITERRRAEEEIQHSLSLLRATLDSTGDGILVVDLDGRIVDFNQRFREMWRIPEHVLETRDDARALAYVTDQLADPRRFLAKVRRLYEQPEAVDEDVITFRDGRVFERYSRPQKLGGENVGRVWSFRDVTDRLRTEEALAQSEEQLRQSQKMEAIGTLAGGVAHDFNNLLTAISGYSQLILHRMPDGGPGRAEVLEIQKAATRASALTRQLLAFSRKQVLQPKVLDLAAVVLDMEKMLRRLIGEHIDLVTAFGRGGLVRADPGQIEQVVMNLAVNARDAMPGGGRLTIETANIELDEAYARTHKDVKPGAFVMLAVSDTGVGMDREVQSRIFEPFFTTKEKGKGTGLGLSTVYGIVRQSGGTIWVYSEPGQGTTFKVYLPRASGRVETAAPAAAAAAPAGHETILLVEDEESVRQLVSQVLGDGGYTVLQAADGREGIDVCERHPGPIHILVTDVVMPGMGGVEVARRVAALRPDIRVLYTSGYTDDAVVRHGVLDSRAPFLQKPFTIEALARKVREVLDGPRAAAA